MLNKFFSVLLLSSFFVLPTAHGSLVVRAEKSEEGDKPLQYQMPRVQLINFKMEDPVLNGEILYLHHKDALKSRVQDEIEAKTASSANKSDKITTVTLSEAKIYLEPELRKNFEWEDVKEEEKDKIVATIFSEKYFLSGDVSAPEADIREMNEAQTFQFLSDEPYLGSAIFNTTDTHDHMQREYHRIDPRVFLLPAEVVRKWFYTVNPTWQKMSLEQYESTDKLTLRPQLFEKYFAFPTNSEDRPAYYQSHAVSFLTQELIGDIWATAKRIIDMTTQEDRVVIFGNTPYFVGRAIRALLDHSNGDLKRTIIDLPFSGAPNRRSARNLFNYRSDFVTSERLVHFKNRLQSLELTSSNQNMLKGTTYFVDVIGSGAGPSYTMATILRDFQSNIPESIPNFAVISLNSMSESEERHKMIASHMAKDGETLEFFFPSKEECQFKVPARVVELKGHSVLDFIPDQCPATRIVPKYNPSFWTKEYDTYLTRPLSSMASLMLEHFDENIRLLIAQSEKL